MAARMNNQYEERLGTERMLPLIFKMALPAVAAQFVNLLYNIVVIICGERWNFLIEIIGYAINLYNFILQVYRGYD